MKFKLILTIGWLCFCGMASADDITIKHQLIQNVNYPTNDLAVASLNVMDYGADPTGKTDQTDLFQKLLDRLANVGNPQKRGDYRNLSGGILYVPAGRYLFKGQLIIPTGVILRGDWKTPESGKPIEGTIFAIDYGEGSTDEEQAFILMQNSTEVSHINFWYPQQDINNVKVYPPTIHYGQLGMWGNEFCNARYVTFVNSYIAIQYCNKNGGGSPNIFYAYGTPLYKGIQIDNIADVGRFDHIHFSPDYWSSSQLPHSPSRSEVAAWLYNNAYGFVMKRNDWSYACNIEIEGYYVGFLAGKLPDETQTNTPNGHNFNWSLHNCKTGILINAISNAGARFTHVNTPGCEIGLHLEKGATGPSSFQECTFEGREQAVLTDADAGSPLHLTGCEMKGLTQINGGQMIAAGNTFDKNIYIGPNARTLFSGNTLKGSTQIENKSLFECSFSDEPANIKPIPTFENKWFDAQTTRPARATLYVVTDTEFGAQPYPYGTAITNAKDCSSAIQKALNKASENGGGIVYLPAGHYRMDNRIRIPAGVELKGASDIATVPRGQGAILEVLADENNENASPFITMDTNSGLRGLTINYPHQDNPKAPIPYPYTVRGNANCYIVNVGLRTAYRGVDLFTNRCDNHYVDYISGHCFRNVIRIGGESKGGVVSNIQCNCIAYGCGDETKFGAWPNSEKMADSYGLNYDKYVSSQNKEQLDFMIVGDCREEVLYNNFLFGCHQGLVFQDDGKGGADVKAIGNAVDGVTYTIVVNGLASDLDLVNSQLVALDHKDYVIDKAENGCYITLGPNLKKTVTMMGSDNWGNGAYFASVEGGTLRLQQAHLAQSGAIHTFHISNHAHVEITDGLIQNVNALVAESGNMEKYLSINSSVIDLKGVDESKLKVANHLLPIAWQLKTENIISREGWQATANVNNINAKNAIDGESSTRWSTNEIQKEGEWLCIDMQNPQTFNSLILDTYYSANDGPKGYYVEISNDNINWEKVAEGSDGGALLVISLPTLSARYIRITQTGNKESNYWSVHELYIALADRSTGIKKATIEDNDLQPSVFYTLSGMASQSPSAPGIYIDKKTKKKVVIR